MLVTRISALTGIKHTMDLPITVEQLLEYDRGGLLIQEAFPNLTIAQREFFKTGITEEEWDNEFNGLED